MTTNDSFILFDVSGDEYHIDRRLGYGRGYVFKYVKAEDPTAAIVVKEIRDRASSLEEFELHMALKHDHIVRCLGQLTGGGMALFYFGIPYCPQGDLRMFYAAQPDRRLNPLQVHKLMVELISALEYLHGLGFVHRHLRTGNILIDSNGASKLSNFEMAKPFDSAHSKCGSVGYRAPENICVSMYTTASDIFGLGVILYEAAVGSPPFDNYNEAASDLMATFYAFRSLPEFVTPEIKELVTSLMHVYPECRPNLKQLQQTSFYVWGPRIFPYQDPVPREELHSFWKNPMSNILEVKDSIVDHYPEMAGNFANVSPEMSFGYGEMGDELAAALKVYILASTGPSLLDRPPPQVIELDSDDGSGVLD